MYCCSFLVPNFGNCRSTFFQPTNNLDLESVASLVESVQKFEGAVICVSHDNYFVESVANEAWVVNDGKVQQVASFEAYRKSQFKVLNKTST